MKVAIIDGLYSALWLPPDCRSKKGLFLLPPHLPFEKTKYQKGKYMKFIFKPAFSLFSTAFLIYILLWVMMGGAIFQHQDYAHNYQTIYLKPTSQATHFEEWLSHTRVALKESHKLNVVRETGVWFIYPGMRAQYRALHDEFEETRAQYTHLVDQLAALFNENKLIKQSWELAVLKRGDSIDLNVRDVGDSFLQFISSPESASEPIGEFLAFDKKKLALQSQLRQIETMVVAESNTLRFW